MSEEMTTNFPCPTCQAVLTTRTAVAHVCGAGTGETAAEGHGDARMSETTTGSGSSAVRPLQTPHGPSEPTSAGGALLSTADLARIAHRWAAAQTVDAGTLRYVLRDVATLLASYTALTARLAEAEQRTEQVTQHAVEVLMGRCEAPDHHGPPTWEEFLAGGGTACPMCLTARLVAVEGERDAALADVARLRARTHELQYTYSQALAPLQKRLAWFEGLWVRSLRWIEGHQPDFEREQIADWVARAAEDVKERIVRYPCSAAERARIGELLAILGQVEAERDAAVAALTALEQVICSSVVLPYAPEGPPDGR